MLREIPKARQLAEAGRLCAGTVDSWLLWNLTGGASFASDHSNASRTQLFDTRSMSWNPELARIFGASVDCLPDTLPSDSDFGVTAAGATVLPAGVPIRAMMGDSHAALYGHGLRTPGGAKATFGTGTSVMMLVPGRTASRHGLSGTIAWTDGNGTAFALEGNITVSGQAAAFMADCLGLGGAAALSELAATVGDSGGVSVVPALAGLGAPHWSDTASGLITGLTHATTQAHIARATLEAIAHQVADVVEAMAADSGTAIPVLRADGGAVTSQLLMQIQADLLGVNVSAAVVPEIGAFGAAAMAAAALGADLPLPQSAALHEPQMTSETRGGKRALWRRAVRQCLAGAA